MPRVFEGIKNQRLSVMQMHRKLPGERVIP